MAHPVHEGGLGFAGRVGFFKSFLQALILGLLLCMEDGGIPEEDDTVDDRHLPGGCIKDGILRHEDGLLSQTGSPQGVCSRYSTVTYLKPEWKRSSSFDAVSTMR